METNNEEIKRGRGRPKKYENGAKAHEKETKYSTDYYRKNKGERCICQVCKKDVSKWTLKNHMNTKSCQLIKTINENTNI